MSLPRTVLDPPRVVQDVHLPVDTTRGGVPRSSPAGPGCRTAPRGPAPASPCCCSAPRCSTCGAWAPPDTPTSSTPPRSRPARRAGRRCSSARSTPATRSPSTSPPSSCGRWRSRRGFSASTRWCMLVPQASRASPRSRCSGRRPAGRRACRRPAGRRGARGHSGRGPHVPLRQPRRDAHAAADRRRLRDVRAGAAEPGWGAAAVARPRRHLRRASRSSRRWVRRSWSLPGLAWRICRRLPLASAGASGTCSARASRWSSPPAGGSRSSNCGRRPTVPTSAGRRRTASSSSLRLQRPRPPVRRDRQRRWGGGGGGASFAGSPASPGCSSPPRGWRRRSLAAAHVAAGARRRPLADPPCATHGPDARSLIAFGGWLLVTGLVFSYMQGTIHPYYAVALAPAIAGIVAVTGGLLWEQRPDASPRGRRRGPRRGHRPVGRAPARPDPDVPAVAARRARRRPARWRAVRSSPPAGGAGSSPSRCSRASSRARRVGCLRGQHGVPGAHRQHAVVRARWRAGGFGGGPGGGRFPGTGRGQSSRRDRHAREAPARYGVGRAAPSRPCCRRPAAAGRPRRPARCRPRRSSWPRARR